MNNRWICGLLAAVMLVSVLSGLPTRTSAAETMTVSQDMIDVLKKMEGFSARRYWDYSQWTVGYGTQCPSDMMDEYAPGSTGRDITVAEAEALLRSELSGFEKSVNSFAEKYGLTFKQNEFDALVSITYNLGAAWTKNEDGLLNMAIRSGATGSDLIYCMALHSKAGGNYLNSLARRRLSEAYMFLEGKYEAYNKTDDGTYPDTYGYIYLDGNGGEVYNAIHGYDGADPKPVRTYFSDVPTGVDAEGNSFVYTFAGWYTEPVGGTKIEILDGSVANKTVLYAQWADPTGQIVSLPKGDVLEPLEVTVTTKAEIRSGPATFYKDLGDLAADSVITVTETYTCNSKLWGKYDGGWILLSNTNYQEALANREALEEDVWPKSGTVTGDKVNVRSGPGTSYDSVEKKNTGDSVLIYEIVYDGSKYYWGKLEDGNWICMNYVTLQSTGDSSTETPTATGAVLLSGPTQTDYVQMQHCLDLQGTLVQITYSDGSISAHTLSQSEIKSYSNATLGETIVTATCSGFEVTFPVNIVMATVTFCNEDGTVLSQGQYAYGETVSTPEVPPKAADDAGEYEFVGWSPELTTVKGNKTYTAVFQLIVPTEPETSTPETTEPSEPAESTDPSDPSDSTEPEQTEPTEPPEWPKSGTVSTQSSNTVNVRTGAGTSYEKADYKLNVGATVMIYEIVYDGSQYFWGKLEDGNWVCMKYVLTDEEWDDSIPGDVDGNWMVNEDDAIYLLRSIFFPEDYPVSGNADFNADGTVNEDDAIYLLRYLFFPEDYPLAS